MKNEVRPIEKACCNCAFGHLAMDEKPCVDCGGRDTNYSKWMRRHPVLENANIGRKPLTIEQLREMVDKPAYLYIYDTALDSGWEIIKTVTKDKIIFRGWNTVYVPISSLGKCFDLYAYPPAHIDREAWKCPLCERSKVISFEAWEDESKLPKGQSVREGALFCPHCGKPRTPEAWTELEKRMGVRV